jgi:ribosomal-protein-alanine N-acetyltransferase
VSVLSRLLQRDDTQLVIEPMRRRHLKGIMAIEPRVYPRPWSASVFIDEIDMAHRGQRVYIVAKLRGQLVGYAGMILGVDEAHVTNIAVEPQRHRQGVGRRLMVHLARAARAKGYKAMTLEVRVTNVGAQAMYRKFGFAPAGIRKKYYEQTEDAIVMWANDIDTPAYAERLDRLEHQE